MQPRATDALPEAGASSTPAGPLSENTTPAYLTGEFPGDYGWVSRSTEAFPCAVLPYTWRDERTLQAQALLEHSLMPSRS